MSAPLHGIRIIECASAECPLPLRLAMSFAARMAADLGAEVIKLGSREQDPVQSIGPFIGKSGALSSFLDVGKSCLPYPEYGDAVDALLKLESTPNIIFCDDRAFLKMGSYGDTAIRAVLSMSSGTDAANESVASEFTTMASTGLLDLVGDPDREPLRMGGHQLAYSCGLSAYAGAVAALSSQMRNGQGEVVRIALADVGVWLNWKSVATSSWSTAGRARLGRDAEWQVVRCADGWMALVFLEADWPVLRDFVGDARLFDVRFEDRNERRRDARTVTEIIENKFMQSTRRELKEMALSKRLPLGPVWTPLELESDPQNVERAFFSRVDLEKGPPLLMPRLPILWNGAACHSSVAHGAAS